jgi:Tfp pilus assembly protein PilZ
MWQFIRHSTTIPIEYAIGDSTVYSKEYLKNISQGGLCIRADVNIKPGSEILIRIPMCMPVFEAEGVVIWCNKANKKYEVGVKFTDKETEFRLRMVEQICYIEPYKKKTLKKESQKLSEEAYTEEWIDKYAKYFP